MRIEPLFRLLRYRRAVALAPLAAMIVAAWAYLFLAAAAPMEMDMGGGQFRTGPTEWSLAHAALISTMWIVMMAAMMLPTIAPTVLLVTALAGDRLTNSNLIPASALLFASGYLVVWSAFSLAATLLQWNLGEAGLFSGTMAFGSALLANVVLIGAGIYQWTPLKDACLRHCRSPTEFLARHWRGGMLGAVQTGVRHGLFCLGCCWMLMALLFVGGVMNLAWVAAIGLLVLLEKTIPWGGQMSRLTGAVLVAWGVIGLLGMI